MKTHVPDNWEIPSQIRERFGDTAGRQRAMSADGHLLIVLHDPPTTNARDRTARLLWRQPNGTWSWNKDGSVSHLLKKHVAEFSDRYEQLEKQLQVAASAADYFQILQAVMPLHRTSRNLHSTLQQARECVPGDHDIIVARDAASDIERAFELLTMEAKNGLDYTVACKTEQQSQTSYEMAVAAHRLNLLAALFFPITAISSVFGMNVAHGLSCPGNLLFWGVLAVGLLSGIALTRLIMSGSVKQPERVPEPLVRVGRTSQKRQPAKQLRKLPAVSHH